MIRAVIFDLDGVLVHTDALHYRAWSALAGRLGLPFDAQLNDRLRGVSRRASLELILGPEAGRWTEEEKEAMCDEKNRAYRSLLASLGPGDVEGDVSGALNALRARGLLLAVGSGSRNAGDILARTGLTRCFDAIVAGDDIQRAKPDPEVFLLAAERLGVAPSQALVVEDAAAGLAAAHAGGFHPVAFHFAQDHPLQEYRIERLGELLDILS